MHSQLFACMLNFLFLLFNQICPVFFFVVWFDLICPYGNKKCKLVKSIKKICVVVWLGLCGGECVIWLNLLLFVSIQSMYKSARVLLTFTPTDRLFFLSRFGNHFFFCVQSCSSVQTTMMFNNYDNG